MPPIARLIAAPSNTTYADDVLTLLGPQARDLGIEHMLLLNSSYHVVWSANPGSQLVGHDDDNNDDATTTAHQYGYMQVGTIMDPGRVVSRAFRDNKEYRSATVEPPNVVLVMDRSPRYRLKVCDGPVGSERA